MMIVGLTGGIGSGKTTVAKMFQEFDIPVYIADDEAKKLMVTSKFIKRKLIALFGDNVYVQGQLNKPLISQAIFNDKEKLKQMNAIVHPRVGQHFDRWVKKQNTPYVLKESAILFESGGADQCDLIVTVTAPKEIRIERVLERDDSSKEKVESIMANQLGEKEKIAKSNFVIHNLNLEETKKQVREIHLKILQKVG
ncbi:dephospho-CoA kinase [Mangrovimonas sp. AS39]|uniref:dephospho-CoA kinase n=1 Tax=Mangrovimonas futianensis TaxID=2895523 RepID=UPI001E42947A|nr:dephospho-CoA kinase [Mangrovimonas futianensis]MCF1192643.1 dephospho-CoA kinase [Mangrovimonas futianensis]MCF1196436.1 dephospho-CoA kinase [Mangrovimonas futianensis]